MSEIVSEGIAAVDTPETLLGVFTPLVDEAKMHFNDDGVHMRAVDPSNIAMSWADLDRAAFEAYDSPGAVTIGANLERIGDRFGLVNNGDMVELAVDMESRHLHVRTDTVDSEVALIDPDAIRSEPDMPEIDLPNTVELTRDQLARALEAVGLSSDHVEIIGDVDGKCVRFVGEGDTDRDTVEYDRGDVQEGTAFDENAASLFSHEYLDRLVSGIPKQTDVTLRFGEEWPMKLEWTALEGYLDVTQMCAPRIRSD